MLLQQETLLLVLVEEEEAAAEGFEPSTFSYSRTWTARRAHTAASVEQGRGRVRSNNAFAVTPTSFLVFNQVQPLQHPHPKPESLPTPDQASLLRPQGSALTSQAFTAQNANRP